MAKKKTHQITVIKTTGDVKLDRNVRSFIREYLDEVYKNYMQRRRPDPKKRPDMMAINGVDYFSAHAQGRVTVHGYLRRFFAEQTGKKPEDCDKDKLITQLASSIHTAAIRLGHAREGSEIAAKFAFCLSPELSRSWKQAGVDIDAGLRQVVDETLARYSRFAMDGTELGYAVGIHHDKQHVHAHVFLMRRASNGKLLRLSNRHVVTENGITQKHDYLNILIKTANSVLREYQNKLTKAKVNLGNTQSLSADIERWINLATYDRIPAGIKGAAAEEWAITEKERLRQSPPEVLIRTLDSAYAKRITTFRQYQHHSTQATGRDALETHEQQLRTRLEQQLHLHRIQAQEEREARKAKNATLKTKKLELQLVNAVMKINKARLLPIALKQIDQIHAQLRQNIVTNPLLRNLIAERLNLAKTIAGRPLGNFLDQDKALMERINRKNLGFWKTSLERQYNDLKNNTVKKIETKYKSTVAADMQVEELKARLDLVHSACSLKNCPLLDRYQKMRLSPDIETVLGIAPLPTPDVVKKPLVRQIRNSRRGPTLRV